MMKKALCLLLAFLFLFPAFALAETVITSFYPVWILTLNLTNGLEGVDVVNLAEPSTGCLHDYTLQNSDMVVLSEADALLINGAGMESFLPVITGAYPDLPVIDATAGLGEDSLLLAAAGFSVTLFENDPVIAALLSDALRRAEEVPELSEAVSRMRFIEGDSITAMRRMTEGMFHSGSYDCFKANEGRNETAPPVLPEVILLDPMFPEREKSALVKKKFQLLQKLERPCDDEEALF